MAAVGRESSWSGVVILLILAWARSWVGCRLPAIGGREYAELGDGRGNNFKGGIDLGFGGVAAETEADAGSSFGGR